MTEQVAVFFYGLFMDASLLASRGIDSSEGALGHVEGYAIRIGDRATLVRKRGGRAYGLLVMMTPRDLESLYSDPSVADYVAESVSVVLTDGSMETATCYNLPEHELEGVNVEYALSLLSLAAKLGLPDGYLEEIRKQAS